jgi:hypothetical protein
MLILSFTALAVLALLMVPLTLTLCAAALLLRSCASRAADELPVALELLVAAFAGEVFGLVADEQALRARVTAVARAKYDSRLCPA